MAQRRVRTRVGPSRRTIHSIRENDMSNRRPCPRERLPTLHRKRRTRRENRILPARPQISRHPRAEEPSPRRVLCTQQEEREQRRALPRRKCRTRKRRNKARAIISENHRSDDSPLRRPREDNATNGTISGRTRPERSRENLVPSRVPQTERQRHPEPDL